MGFANLHEKKKFEKFRVQKSRYGNVGPGMSGPEELVQICRCKNINYLLTLGDDYAENGHKCEYCQFPNLVAMPSSQNRIPFWSFFLRMA
jgi:hypothetical protein